MMTLEPRGVPPVAAGDHRRRCVHQSLIRTPLYAGVDQGFLIFEVTTVGFLFFALGLGVVTVLIGLAWMAVVHPLMAWVSRKDPLLPVFYVRSLAGKDYYAPHGPPSVRAPQPRASLPS